MKNKDLDFDIESELSGIFKELMKQDWKKMLTEEIGKITGKPKTKKKSGGMTILAAFAIGYFLGSLRR